MPYSRIVDLSSIDAKVSELLEYAYHGDVENHHETHIWPSPPSTNAVLTAGAVIDVWSPWNRLVDSLGAPFHQEHLNVHISAIILESASAGTDIYNIQLAYGSDLTTITRLRFSSATIGQLPPLHTMKIRADNIPMNERVYYRCRCTVAGATVNISLRWHPDYEIEHGFYRLT